MSISCTSEAWFSVLYPVLLRLDFVYSGMCIFNVGEANAPCFGVHGSSSKCEGLLVNGQVSVIVLVFQSAWLRVSSPSVTRRLSASSRGSFKGMSVTL